MHRNRLIPIITIDNGRMVKTIKFRKPNYLGDPINALKIFNDKSVDEVAVLDIGASQRNTEPNYQLLEEMASEAFMPLGYGGGIRNIEQVKRIFSLGFEKIIINSSAQNNTQLITEIASIYGGQSVVISLDVLKTGLFRKKYRCAFKSARIVSKIDPISKLKEIEVAGAGEVILHFIDNDGTFKGFDLDYLKLVAASTSIPVVCCGGLNGLEMARNALKSGASAVGGGSWFVYKNNNPNSILISYPNDNKLMNEYYL